MSRFPYRPSPNFIFTVLVVLIVMMLAAMSANAAAPTSDLLGKYDGPVVEVPMFTATDNDGGMSMEVIKLPDAREVGLLPYACFHSKGKQEITCIVVNLKTGTAYMKVLFLKRLET